MEGLSARAKRFNVFVNAIGTMLVYTSFFAGTMLLVSTGEFLQHFRTIEEDRTSYELGFYVVQSTQSNHAKRRY